METRLGGRGGAAPLLRPEWRLFQDGGRGGPLPPGRGGVLEPGLYPLPAWQGAPAPTPVRRAASGRVGLSEGKQLRADPGGGAALSRRCPGAGLFALLGNSVAQSADTVSKWGFQVWGHNAYASQALLGGELWKDGPRSWPSLKLGGSPSLW